MIILVLKMSLWLTLILKMKLWMTLRSLKTKEIKNVLMTCLLKNQIEIRSKTLMMLKFWEVVRMDLGDYLEPVLDYKI